MICQSASVSEPRRIRNLPLVVGKIRGTNAGDWLWGLTFAGFLIGLVMA